LYDYELIKYAQLLKIPHFIGVYCRDKLPSRPKRKETCIINLDTSDGTGTHWVAYKKIGNNVEYYDSFGNLPPPLELQKYFIGCRVKYNYERYQNFDTTNCGQLCLKFLSCIR